MDRTDPWPIDPTCLPLLPGIDSAGLYPEFVPGPDALPGGPSYTGDPVPVFYANPDDPWALGAARDFVDPVQVTRLRGSISAAVATLSALLGHRYVVRCVTARPCSTDRGSFLGPIASPHGGWWIAYQDANGGWHNYDPCGSGRCDPLGRGAVELPTRFGQVTAVTAVTVDGSEIAPSGYAYEYVHGRPILYRLGADGCGGAWPTQDLSLPLGCPGTWSVTFRAGYRPPPGTAQHVATLAGEFFRLCSGDEDGCRLPRGWASVSRDGVTVESIDAAQMLDRGLTGLAEVDAWVRAWNPHRLATPVTVVGPGTLRGIR